MEKKKKQKESLDKALFERKSKIVEILGSASPELSLSSLSSSNVSSSYSTAPSPEDEKIKLQSSNIKIKTMDTFLKNFSLGSENKLEATNLEKDLKPTLENISFKIPKGSLTMIIGGVGSGKSSIGAALIGFLFFCFSFCL
jgi:ABC-type multidrug transport system fused ATPase/permease subunit